MNNNGYLKEELDYLLGRSWDFIARLDNLERKVAETVSADERQALKTQIKTTRRLLDTYKFQYKTLCEEAGIPTEDFTLNMQARVPARVNDGNIASALNAKTIRTYKQVSQGQYIDLAPFFIVPARNAKFTGRQKEVREFIERVIAGQGFVVCGVKGMGGIGKSEIAKEVCHLFHETWQVEPQLPDYVADLLGNKTGFFCDGILWIEFEPEQQTPDSLTKDLIARLVEPERAQDIPNLDEVARILAGKNVLIVLDSVEQNLGTFDYVLDRFKGKFSLLITSRIAILGIHTVDIDVLTTDEAEALFIKHVKIPDLSPEYRQSVAELCRLVGNHPLGITIIASLVKADNSNLTDLKTKWQDKHSLLLEQRWRDTEIEWHNADLKTCFTMSFDTLDEQEQRAFCHAALFNNPFTVSALAALLDAGDEREMEHVVARLLSLSLLDRVRGNASAATYSLHTLMREFALDVLLGQVQAVPHRKKEVIALLESLQHMKEKGTLLKQLKDPAIREQVADAMHYCNRMFNFAMVREFMDVLDRPWSILGHWNEINDCGRLAVRAAVALQERSRELAWRMSVGYALHEKATSTAELEQARKSFEHALRIAQQLKDARNVVYIMYRVVLPEVELEHWDIAIHKIHQGIREACRYGEFYWLGAFVKTLGVIYNSFVNEQASLFFLINFKIKLRFDRVPSENMLMAYEDNVDVLYKRGEVEICRDHYQKILQLQHELDTHTELYTIGRLFDCHLRLQEQEACERYLKHYGRLSTEMGLADSTRQSMIGRFAWLGGNYADAAQALLAASAHSINKFDLQFWLGKVHLYQGNLDVATDYLNSVLEIRRGQKNAVEMATVYTQLALLALKRGRSREAVQHLSTSLKTQRAHGIETSREEAQIQRAIREQLREEGTDPEQYERVVVQAQSIGLKPHFLTPDLPQTYIGHDGKSMLLIPAGPVFIGKGQLDTLTAEQLLNNSEQYLHPYRQHSDEYRLPLHPDVVFDKERVSFLLMQTQSMSDEEKRQTRKAIPNMAAEELQQLIKKLEQEHQAANQKATQIYLYAYYIDREPVSNAEYKAFCADTEHARPSHWRDGNVPDDADDLPVVNIRLEDAKAYAQWAGKEIPTAPEWEKACRGEQGAWYPWGDDWDESLVKVKDGAIGKRFEAEYLQLNDTIPMQGGLVHFKTPRFILPMHQLDVDEEEFLGYLQGSLSLRPDEKRKIVAALPRLTQTRLDELVAILRKEKAQFAGLGDEHRVQLNRLRKACYVDLMEPELTEMYLSALNHPIQNESTYGVHDLVGSIYQMTVSEIGTGFVVKGGSWFSENPREACIAWAVKTSGPGTKRMDMGFRCVIPMLGHMPLKGSS